MHERKRRLPAVSLALVCAPGLVALLFGCSAQIADRPASVATTRSPGPELFPQTVGTQWRYLARAVFTYVGDTTREQCADTIVVQITDTATHTLRERPATHWSLHGNGLCLGLMPASLWVTAAPTSGAIRDTLVFDWSLTDSIPNFILVFPLRVGAVWACKQCNPLRHPARVGAEVASLEDVATPAGDFTDAFHVVSRCSVRIPASDLNLNGWGIFEPGDEVQTATVEYWIKPEVGIVRLIQTVELQGGSLGQRVKKLVFEWNLLSWEGGRSPSD